MSQIRRSTAVLSCFLLIFVLVAGILALQNQRLQKAQQRMIPLMTPTDLTLNHPYALEHFFSAELTQGNADDAAVPCYLILLQDSSIEKSGYNDMGFLVVPKNAVTLTNRATVTPTGSIMMKPVVGEGNFGLNVYLNAATVRPDTKDPKLQLIASTENPPVR